MWQNRKYTKSLWIMLRVWGWGWGSQSWSSSVSLRHSVVFSPIWEKKKKRTSLARMDATPSPSSSGQTSSKGNFLFLNRIAVRWSLPQSNWPISTRSKWNSPLFEDCLPTSRETCPNFGWTRSISLLRSLSSDRGEENLYQRWTSRCTGPGPSGMTDDLDQEGRRSERSELLCFFFSLSIDVRRSGSHRRRWSSSGSLPFLSIARKHRDIDEHLLHWWQNEETPNQPSSSIARPSWHFAHRIARSCQVWPCFIGRSRETRMAKLNREISIIALLSRRRLLSLLLDVNRPCPLIRREQRRPLTRWTMVEQKPTTTSMMMGDNWHIRHGKRKRKFRDISLSLSPSVIHIRDASPLSIPSSSFGSDRMAIARSMS